MSAAAGRESPPLAAAPDPQRDFAEDYYAAFEKPYQQHESHYRAFFEAVSERVAQIIAPARVLDAGCAMGWFVAALRRRGIDAYGFDVSSYALAHLDPAIADRCWMASVSDEIDGHYDLITCFEVFAHVPPTLDEGAVANLCRHTDSVLFSASPVDPSERRHANTNPPEHFADLFARNGFFRDAGFDASIVTPWAVLYRRRPVPVVVRDYEHELHRLRTLHAQLIVTQQQLTTARETIQAMERSWFWKLRRPWAKLTGR